MKKHLLALAAMTLTTFAFAAAPEGDIYSITPITDTSKLLVAGDKVAFRVRLLARKLDTIEVAPSAWQRVYLGGGSEILEDLQNPPKIGIIVSGHLRYADIIDAQPREYRLDDGTIGYPYTDLICEYKVLPGDIARPVYLALAGSTDANPIIPGDAGAPDTTYATLNIGNLRWGIASSVGGATVSCNFAFCSSSTGSSASEKPWISLVGDLGDYNPDYDLSAASFQVQSINFDENMDSENYWREVKEGTTQTTYTPMIKTVGKPEQSGNLYVWSDNKDAVVVTGSNVAPVDFKDNNGVVTHSGVQVATIKMVSGIEEYPFQIKGVKKGETANLILSPTIGYRYDIPGDKITNFVSIAVRCIEPPSPNLQVSFDPANPTSAKTLTMDTSMKQVENLAEDAKPLYITLSEPFAEDVEIALTFTNVAKNACNPITNLNIAVEQYGDSFSTAEADRAFTNLTIKAGDTMAQVYLYPLGGTPDTQSQGISINAVIKTPSAKEHYEIGQRALLKVRSAHKPTITTPEAGTNYDAQEPTGFTVNVGVADCYRDLNLKQGFKVDVDYSDGSKMTTTNVVFTENGEIPITLTGYGINVTYANIKVTEPDGTAYATVKVYFTVKPQKTVSAALYDSDAATEPHVGTSFKEGDTPIVRFTISEKKPAGESNNLYAFLVPQNEASSNCVDCAAFREGVLIPGGQTESALSVYWKLNFVDGTAYTDGSKGLLSYKIVLRTANTLEDGTLEESYIDTDGLQFTVANVDTKVDGVMVNGDPDSVAKGQLYSQTVPAESAIPFIVSMTDPSVADQTNGLISVWIFTSGRSRISYNYSCVTSKTDTATMEHTFSDPGTTQTVQVVAIDKDLLESLKVELKDEASLATFWTTYKKNVGADAAFSFKVAVDEAPMIILTPEELSFDENSKQDVLKNQKITVELNNPAPSPLTVRLSLKPYTDENFGSLKFKAEGATYDPATGISTLDLEIKKDAVVPTKKPNVYVGGVELEAASLDGVAASMDDGWYLEAKVVDGAVGEYSDGTGAIYVRNTPPVIRPVQGENITTNKQLSVGESYTFTWGVSDVMEDMTNFWSGTTKRGIKCDWYVNDGLQSGLTTYVTNTTDQTTTIQINQEGLTTIKLVATDKDGEDYASVAKRIWLFYIAPTKKLAVTPVGPATDSKTKYFTKAKGLGMGRTWTPGNGLTLLAFQQTWNFNITSPDAEVRAYGYASANAPYEDNGSLGPGARDVKISPTGDTPTDEYFEYDGVYDNYFYRWAFITPGENGGGSSITYGNMNPTKSPLAEASETVLLDEYDEKKEAYQTKRVEAIFSREMFTGDNLGDINQDYIPDLYTTFYPNFGIANEEGEITGDDLKDLSKFNDDSDYLPNTMDAPYASFIPQLSNTWVTAGRAFNARLEVRGYGNGLNDAPALAKIKGAKPERIYEDPTVNTNSTLAYVEWVAFTNYCERAGLGDPANKANWQKWSPERPTDPTVYDTDDDGMPDGYEYYIWYKAHVGELVVTKEEKQEKEKKVMVTVTNLVRYTGRRYNIVDPVHPIIISADEIEKLYDPITPNDLLSEIDTDLDGIPDLIEFEIGTNPFDYDTDHDLLPDGWEVSFSKTDPLNANNDNEKNEDGDMMAYASMPFWRYDVEGSNEVDGVWVTVTNYVYSYGKIATTGVDAEYPHSIFTAFPYKPGEIDENGKQKPDDYALGEMLIDRDDEDCLTKIAGLGIVSEGKKVSLAVMHDQLLKYKLKSFDPRTGWNKTPPGVDTKAFQNYDEFMMLAWYLNCGEATLGKASLDIEDDPHFGSEKLIDIWARTTTHPLKADTNGDGVPDGWQLYVSWNPATTPILSAKEKKDPKVMKNLGPFSNGAPIFDIGTGAKGLDTDKDGLDLQQEFCGIESCKFYEKCETIENVQPEWRNKTMPTDPWNRDTDGDGLTDGEEHTWLYGTAGMDGGGLNPLSWDTDLDGLPDPWELEFCGSYSPDVRGEAPAAITTTNDVAVADGGTTNEVTTTLPMIVNGQFNNDGMNPTAKDESGDYDGDGLLNWQEYMVGTMRCWRYDDTVTPWVPSDGIFWGNAYKVLDPDLDIKPLFSGIIQGGYAQLFKYLGEEGRWTVTKDMEMFEAPEEDYVYNRGFRSGHIDPGVYFSCCKNVWDPAFGRLYYFKDGIDHDLKNDWFQPYKEMKDYTTLNRWQAVAFRNLGEAPFIVAVLNTPIYPTKYISCDPRESDTDFDGMDDYYELFHGLNPLLGAPGVAREKVPCDIVFKAYGGGQMPNATSNYYLYWNNEVGQWAMNLPMRKTDGRPGSQGLRLKGVGAYSDDPSKYLDFYQFPWLAGLPTADPDGDNIRNQQESILLKPQAAPTYQHTDPTPLWMTDTSFDYSLTKRFYQAQSGKEILCDYRPEGEWDPEVYGRDKEDTPVKSGWFVHNHKVYEIDRDFPWLKYDPNLQAVVLKYDINSFGAPANLYSYEENEGYDSDHDYLSDFEESQARTKAPSDPQQHDSPIRHQAMYFDGVDSRLQAPLEVPFPLPDPMAASEQRQDFLYFTVEAWVKIDQSNIDDGALHTVIERAILTGESGPADETFLRKNFLIGVKGGKWYGKFDSTGTDAGQAIEILDGPAATTAWTHLTLTYGPANGDELDDTQPMALRLYVHDTKGELIRKSELGNVRIQPEHGESAIIINRESKVGMEGTTPWAKGITIVVGASVRTPSSTAVSPYGMDVSQGMVSDYSNYFKGYIDEVRIWDGARQQAEITDDVMTRYTSALAQENRARVFAAWNEGGLRSPMSPTALPPELRYHWAFDHLPSAVETKDLIIVPAGFSTAESVLDAKAIWVRPEGYICNWWDMIPTVSEIFTDHAWVPWINNTVSHLPCFDGSTLDSIYWSESFAGDQSVTNFASSFFAFPRTAEVWSRLTMSSVPKTWWTRTLDQKATRFNLRNRVTVGADLLPLGHAFPKRISADEGGMWDDPSASDAWAETGADNDDNGLPDWWEKYAMKNYSPVLGRGEKFGILTAVNYHGTSMSAKEAYLFDLAAGMLPDGKLHNEYADQRDNDNDGLPDWWEDVYGIQTNSPDDRDADPDKDGLSNYQEYLLSIVYPREHEADFKEYGIQAPHLNPMLARSSMAEGVNQLVTDYYLRYSDMIADEIKNSEGWSNFYLNEYFGEIATDHDFMEDWWEKATGKAYADPAKYDPLQDRDEDGWSNWAECRAALWGGYFSAELIDKWTGSESSQHVSCYPEPILGVKVTYHGVQDISGQQLVIKATTGQTPRTDATFVIPAEPDSQTRYIGGFNADYEFHGHMSPGLINPNSIAFEAARTSSGKVYIWSWDWYDQSNITHPLVYSGSFETYRHYYALYPNIELRGGDLTWEPFGQILASGDLSAAKVVIDGGIEIGSIDCTTGEYSLNMSKFPLEGTASEYVFRVTYTSRVGHEWPQTVYVSDTKELATGTGVTATGAQGRLREGRNNIEAFIDLNASGTYDEGEPYGSIRNVQVGWHKVPTVTIELKDSSPIMNMVSVGGGAGGDLASALAAALGLGGGATGDGLTMKVRVVRELINEVKAVKTLATKTIVLDDRPYLTELDVCTSAKPDLDWGTLVKDAERAGVPVIESATYAVYQVDEETSSNATQLASFVKRFPETRPLASAVAPIDRAPVYTSSPTFSFTISDAKATAYRLQVRRPDEKELIYDSGTALLPGRVGTTVGACACEVTPAIYADVPVYTGITTNRLVFADNTNYQWRVALFDAKYNSTTDDGDYSSEWSAWSDFEMDVRNQHRYPYPMGNTDGLSLAVRYYGPCAMNPTNIIVEAYENADFRGQALAQIRLSDLDFLARTDDIETANAILRGISAQTVFVRAFYDQNDNGLRDNWESWGYANEVGTDLRAIYNPRAVNAGTKSVITIYMEDCDVNQNEYPDSLEPAKFPEEASVEASEFVDWWDWAEAAPEDATDGSVMAYYETKLYQVTLWDGVDSTRFYSYLIEDGSYVPGSGASATGLVLATCYDYGNRLVGYGVRASTNDYQDLFVYGTPKEVDVVYVHAQVREKFGFSANTAIPGGTENTKAFTAEDKYLVLRYLEQTGRISDGLIEIARNANKSSFEAYVYSSGNEKIYAKYTPKPSLVDSDFDGVPDGWELYVDYDPLNAADRMADDDGDELPLWQEYDQNVKRGTAHPTDPWSIDTDNDGVLDRYAYMYHLKGGDSGEDFDGDGLSNYAEYLITEVFKYAKCDPDNAKTDGACVDCFKKVGSLYLGEIFTDHDQIEDTWEDGFEHSIPGSVNEFFATRYRYDPTKDADNDGWSNYAEYRAGTDPSASAALSIDGYTCPEYPVPTLEVNVTYNGSDLITGPLVIKAWNQKDDSEMVKAPDAIWTLGTTETTATQDGGYQSSANMQGSALQQHEKFLGRKPHGTRTFYLTGGNVSEGSVKLLFIDKGYGLVTYDPILDGFYAVGAGEPDNALWFYGIIDRGGKLVRLGSSIYKALGYEEEVVGTVDYKTGKITINFDHAELCGNMAADPGEGKSGSSDDKNDKGENTDEGLYHYLDLDESYMRIEWKSSQAMVSVAGIHYFSDPDPVSDTAKSHGHLREGMNSFVCFVDDDGDGEYTPGELFGFVRDVDVGWAGAKFSVELTETSPIFGRVGFDGANDRLVWYGTDSGNVTNMAYGSATTAIFGSSSLVDSSLSGGKLQHVRIDRYAVNGLVLGSSTNQIAVPNRVLVDKWFNLGSRPYIFEGDFLEKNIFDIDWENFKSDIVDSPLVRLRFGGAVDSVTYRVVIDNAEAVHPALSNRVLNVAFTRWFDSKQMTPTGLDAMLVYGARPTFRWSMKDENGDIHNSYTAFKLRILADDDTTVIYQSPMTRIPFQDQYGNYVWEAPFSIGDQTPQGQILARAGTFRWTVSMYNAKFKTDAYAPSVAFATAVNQQQEAADHGFGAIKVAVKYTGPIEVLKDCENVATLTNMVRVQAFPTPDFAGIPSAQTVVTNFVALTNTLDNSANVTLYGLPAGEYYVRAYIDSNGNFEKDDFESWGAAKGMATIAANTAAPVVGLYIEDADTDQDWIPDAWEWVSYGCLTNAYTKIDENGIVLKSATYSALTGENAGPNFSRFLTGASLTFFENAEASTKLIPDLDSDTTKTAIEAIRDAIEKKVKPDTLRISSLVVDAAHGEVLLTVDADVTDSISGKLLTPIYELKAPTEVKVSIFKKSSLLVNEWTWVDDIQVTIDERLNQTIAVPVDVDFNSGFYKVEVIQ